jgi:hypothetical protein
MLYVDGIELSYCGQEGLKDVASILLTGDFTVGGDHRSSPTGGSAKGMPRNCATFGVVPLINPYTVPTVVSTLRELTAKQVSKSDTTARSLEQS